MAPLASWEPREAGIVLHLHAAPRSPFTHAVAGVSACPAATCTGLPSCTVVRRAQCEGRGLWCGGCVVCAVAGMQQEGMASSWWWWWWWRLRPRAL